MKRLLKTGAAQTSDSRTYPWESSIGELTDLVLDLSEEAIADMVWELN
jgi:hypothetical protein